MPRPLMRTLFPSADPMVTSGGDPGLKDDLVEMYGHVTRT